MAYTADWSNTIIVDHTKLNEVAAGMRATRLAVSERLTNLIYGFTAGETQTNEGVKNLPFVVQASDPGATVDKVKAYAKDISAKAELHLQDEDGNVVIVTRAGKIAIDSVFRSSDLLHTFSSTIPTNFTDITSTYNGKFLRVSTGTAETTGGADTHTHGAGSYTVPSHNHGGGATPISQAGIGSATDGVNIGDQHREQTATIPTQAAATITGTSASNDNVPAYVQCKLYKRS